jgi:hypothetical protein
MASTGHAGGVVLAAALRSAEHGLAVALDDEKQAHG